MHDACLVTINVAGGGAGDMTHEDAVGPSAAVKIEAAPSDIRQKRQMLDDESEESDSRPAKLRKNAAA